jgi:arginine/lysine/ornithine decarboxylase
LLPGERITKEIIETIKEAKKAGIQLSGIDDATVEKIWVVEEN